MGWWTRTSALPIRDLRQRAYLLPMWGEIWSGVVFLWRRLICPQNSSLRMFWYRDLNSSHFFPRFGALEHEANRISDISTTFISSRKTFSKRNRVSVCSARERKPSILSLSCRLNRFVWGSWWRTTPLQILCHNIVRTWPIGTRLGAFTKLQHKISSTFPSQLGRYETHDSITVHVNQESIFL